MIALLAVAVATAAGMVVVPSDPGLVCPAPEQVTQALRVRLPEVLGEAGRGLPAPLWLQLRGAPAAPEVQLRDARGQVVLSRVLRLQSAAVECVALAETVALIVERYLDELEVKRLEAEHRPALPPARTSAPAVAVWSAGLRVLVHSGQGFWLPPGGEVWFERGFGLGRWRASWGASLGLLSGTETNATQIARLDAWLLGRAGLWRALGRHSVGVVGELGVAAVGASRSHAGRDPSAWGAEPRVGVGPRYRWAMGTHWFAEASGGVYAAIVRHEMVVLRTPQDERRVVASTPRIFSDFGLGLGLQF